MVKNFIDRNRRRSRIRRVLGVYYVTKIMIPHAMRLNIDFAGIILRAYRRAWTGDAR